MKKKRKTYGVPGMMEYCSAIKIGKATLHVLFTDGSTTAMGQNPAKYTTSDFMIQHALEHSSEFRRGKIVLLCEMDTDEEVYIESNRPACEVEAKAFSDVAEPFPAELQGDSAKGVSEVECRFDSEVETFPSMTAVEFSCNADAKAYLTEKFQVKCGSLKSRADIVSCGKLYGVDIAFVQE